MSMSVRLRLSAMMLLQYAIWGAWAPVLWSYLTGDKPAGLGFNGDQAGWIFSMMPLASIVAPFVAGQLADRLFSSERFMGVLHLLGAVSLYVMAKEHTANGVVLWMLIFSVFYAPTLALTNSVAFSHMKDTEKEFGGIRVWGTLGWIIAGWILSYTRNAKLSPEGMCDSLLLAAAMSALLGILSFSLPHTPPKKEGVNPWAFVDALKLLKNRNFLVFVLVSFVVATELQFYYGPTSSFLKTLPGLNDTNVPMFMTIGQIAEILVMAVLLPALLPKMGIRNTMVVGIIAWPIRYIIFAAGAAIPALKWLVIASLSLHGFCYVFFFTVGFIYADTVAPKDLRASVQGMMSLVVLGAGSFLGSLLTGRVVSMFTNEATKVTNWQNVFLIPVALTILCALIFPALFRDKQSAGGPASGIKAG